MQLLIHLPDTLANRFRGAIPARQRSAFISRLLEDALPEAQDALYQSALAVEQNAALLADLEIWDQSISDGLDP